MSKIWAISAYRRVNNRIKIFFRKPGPTISWFWALPCLLFFICFADYVTTLIGLQTGIIAKEGNPFMKMTIEMGGLFLFSVCKISLSIFPILVIERDWRKGNVSKYRAQQAYIFGIFGYVLLYGGWVLFMNFN